VVQAAFAALSAEISIDSSMSLAAYRTSLLPSLLYKAFLYTLPPDSLPASVRSAAVRYERPVSTATQSYGEDEAEFPLGNPIPKIEGLEQV